MDLIKLESSHSKDHSIINNLLQELSSNTRENMRSIMRGLSTNKVVKWMVIGVLGQVIKMASLE